MRARKLLFCVSALLSRIDGMVGISHFSRLKYMKKQGGGFTLIWDSRVVDSSCVFHFLKV